MRRWLSFGLGLIFSAFFAWLGFRGLNFDELGQVLGKIQVPWLFLAAGVYFIAAYLITWRWHYVLKPVQNIPTPRLFPIVVIGYMGNNIYPARIGEFIRAYFLKRNEGVAYAPALATILVERIFDGLVMLTFIFTALLFVEFDDPIIRGVGQILAPLFFGALLVFFGLALRPAWTERAYTWAITRLFPAKLQPKVLELAHKFMGGLAALSQPQLLGMTWFASLLSWTVEASTYWIVLQAFDFEVSFWVLALVMGLANLTTILPSTPGYVGTFHGVTVLTMTAFGISGEDAGAYAIVMHLVLWLPITAAGFLTLWRMGLGWGDLGRTEEAVIKQEGEA